MGKLPEDAKVRRMKDLLPLVLQAYCQGTVTHIYTVPPICQVKLDIAPFGVEVRAQGGCVAVIPHNTGLMAMVCRHDIPIFLANITTPGEDQRYAVALIMQLFDCLPPNATALVLYDIGCVLQRTLKSVCTSTCFEVTVIYC